MCRKRMPQAVRRNAVDVGTQFYVFIDHPADAAGGYPRSLIIQKTGLDVSFRGRAIIEKNGPRFAKVMHQRLQRVFVKRHDPLFPTLAGYTDHPLAKINVFKVDVYEFADTDARRVKEFDDRTVAAAEIGVYVRRFDKPDGVLHRKMIR